MQPLTCDYWALSGSELHKFLKFVSTTQAKAEDFDAIEARASVSSRKDRTVAILPIHGVLEARPSILALFGVSSYQAIGTAFDAVMADSSIKAVILDVMSPGGMVYGAPELAEKIYSARGTKPIIAVANPIAASGAYWLAAAADRLVITPSGDVGSVGVIWEHVDFSQKDEKDGINVTVIRSQGSPYKAEGNPTEPLSDEARENMQARADSIYSQFVGDLARFRGVSTDYVQENFGQGRVVDASTAMKAKMIDRIDTLQGVVSKLNAGRIRIASTRAEDDWELPDERDLRRQRAELIRSMAEDGKMDVERIRELEK